MLGYRLNGVGNVLNRFDGDLTDIGHRMSAVRGKADVPRTWLERRVLARVGHPAAISIAPKWTDRVFAMDRQKLDQPFAKNRAVTLACMA